MDNHWNKNWKAQVSFTYGNVLTTKIEINFPFLSSFWMTTHFEVIYVYLKEVIYVYLKERSEEGCLLKAS